MGGKPSKYCCDKIGVKKQDINYSTESYFGAYTTYVN